MKSLQALAVAVAFVSFSPLVHAGNVQTNSVVVTQNGDGSGRSFGGMTAARFADNDVELIGCGTRVFDDGAGGTYKWGFCQSADNAGTRAICFTERPDLLEAMKTTGDYSFVIFAWDAAGECTQVGFSTQSLYIPEHLDKKK